MFKFILISTVLFSISTYAKFVSLDLSTRWQSEELNIDSEIDVLVRMGKKISVSLDKDKKLSVDLRVSQNFEQMGLNAQDSMDKSVLIEAFLYLDGDSEIEKQLLSAPKIITHFGQPASISAQNEHGNIQIKITPRMSAKQ